MALCDGTGVVVGAVCHGWCGVQVGVVVLDPLFFVVVVEAISGEFVVAWLGCALTVQGTGLLLAWVCVGAALGREFGVSVSATGIVGLWS